MQNLCSSMPILPLLPTASRPRVSVGVMTVVQGEQNLHKIVPDGILGYWSSMLLRLFDKRRQISTAAVFHENIEDASVAVNVAIVIANDMFMVEVLEDVSADRQN